MAIVLSAYAGAIVADGKWKIQPCYQGMHGKIISTIQSQGDGMGNLVELGNRNLPD